MRRRAAFAATVALAGPAIAAAPAVRLAVTVDDLPIHDPLPAGMPRIRVAERIIAALRAAGLPPTWGFVNAGGLTREPSSVAVLDRWRAAGFPLGNHGYAHADLDQVGPEAFLADVAAGEEGVATRMAGADWHWFRYPYLHEGRDARAREAVRRGLSRRGYRIATVTVSFDDWRWNPPFARCVAAHHPRAVELLERMYFDAAREALDQVDPTRAQVLLLHVGAFTARMMPRLLSLYRARGVRFVSLAEAERDPAYAADLDPSLPPVDRPIAAPRIDHAPLLDRLCREAPARPPVPLHEVAGQ